MFHDDDLVFSIVTGLVVYGLICMAIGYAFRAAIDRWFRQLRRSEEEHGKVLGR